MSGTREVILGIDPGTVVTGYGVVERRGNALSHVASGVIRPRRGEQMPDRLAEVFRGIEELIETHQPDVLVVEEAFFGDNAKTAIKLGQARGIALVLGALHGVKIAEYSPRSIKQAVVGTGRATKEQVAYMVTRVLSLDAVPEPLDAADALAGCVCYAVGPTEVRPAESGHLTKAQQQLRDLGVRV